MFVCLVWREWGRDIPSLLIARHLLTYKFVVTFLDRFCLRVLILTMDVFFVVLAKVGGLAGALLFSMGRDGRDGVCWNGVGERRARMPIFGKPKNGII